ncbi:Growth factor receptor-bound protein 7 [Trachymyrmex septentrionalis]|uniref:Growth factor receptor-bound protein 7 n=1 Tax=Trachymyrmex septentrionalis TaxID=34720 RepID=A0A195FW65_9HYME|nr:Growth factor receptor-bound protein 7 [Trachymyrmex septentrionalis]
MGPVSPSGGIVTTAAHTATELAVPERRFRTTAGRSADRRCPCSHCIAITKYYSGSVKHWIMHRVNDFAFEIELCRRNRRIEESLSHEHDSHFPDERILHHPRAADIQVPIPFKIRLARGPGWRERGWLTAGGEPPAFSLSLALSWFSGTYRSSRRTIQSKHAWFPSPRRFHPPYALHTHTRPCCQARMQRVETEHPLSRMTERRILICHKIIDIGTVEVLRGTVELVNYITFHRLSVHVSHRETLATRTFLTESDTTKNFHNKKIECVFKIQRCCWWKNSVTVPRNRLQTLAFLTLIASPPPSLTFLLICSYFNDNEQLITLAHLSDYNVYRIPNAKRVFGAPFEWGACLRPNSNAEAEDTEAGEPGIKVIIFENEKSRTCWLTAMRLAKHGDSSVSPNSSATGCNSETLHQRTLIHFTRNLRSLTISIGLGLVFVNLRGMCGSFSTFIELMLSVFKSNMARSRLLPVSRNDNDNEKVNRSDRSNKSRG